MIDADAHTIELMVDAAELAERKKNWKLPEPRYTSGFLAKYARLAQGAETGAITNTYVPRPPCPRSSKSRPRAWCSARTRSTARSRKVHAPDTWFLKRGTTGAALRHALIGNSFTAARRIGKQIVLDTTRSRRAPRRAPRHERPRARRRRGGGRPARVREQPRASPKWHRFGVHFADGGSFMLRDPRRLGAVELDPDESRLGPDALTLTVRQLDHALGTRTAPVKAVLMDQARIAGLGNLLVDEALWRAGIDPLRPAVAIDADERRELHKAIRVHAAGARPARRIAHGRHAEGRRRARARVTAAPLLRRRIAGRTTYSCSVHQT